MSKRIGSKYNKSTDEDFVLTFDKVYKAFINDGGIDVFHGMMRSEFRTKSSKLPQEQMKTYLLELKNRPKQLEFETLNEAIEDPFVVLSFEQKTPIQEKVEQHAKWMTYYGNYAYCCSCGAGKTVAGIYLIHKFQCKTLIISSRNAVNDQWFTLLLNIYPQLIIETKDGWYQEGIKLKGSQVSEYADAGITPDISIFSPQYLTKYVDTYNLRAQLIIYDEVHSLLSTEFIKVLLLPLYKVINHEISELPLMVALSATYPTEATFEGKESLKRLNKLFGSVFRINSTITRIPIKVWDYRDHYTRVAKRDSEKHKKGDVLTGSDALGEFDGMYDPLDDYEAVEYFCNKITDEGKIHVCNEYKGLIMTNTIDTSFYAALYVRKYFNTNVILIRAANETCYYFPKDVGLDYEPDRFEDMNPKLLLENKLCTTVKQYQEVVNDCSIIVGTQQRLKEGFSVQNIVWGICTKFVYSTIARIQILGRIRRNSKDPALNAHERVFYVVSGQIPNNLGMPNRKGPPKIMYDLSGESYLFKVENYIKI